jgi:hypothetical protein
MAAVPLGRCPQAAASDEGAAVARQASRLAEGGGPAAWGYGNGLKLLSFGNSYTVQNQQHVMFMEYAKALGFSDPGFCFGVGAGDISQALTAPVRFPIPAAEKWNTAIIQVYQGKNDESAAQLAELLYAKNPQARIFVYDAQ